MKRASTRGKHLWTAWLAALALLLPALSLGAASAAPVGEIIQICTGKGLTSMALDADGKPAKGYMGLPCQDCLSVSMAVDIAPPLTLAQPVRYVRIEAPASAPERSLRPSPRAPPRPPGQGPPLI